MLRHGKMKHYPLFLCCFRTPVIHSFFIIFALLFLSKSVVAMPYAHNALYYPACKDDAYVHADAAAVGCDTPTRSYTIKNVATQGRSFDICEHDKQVPIKLSLLSVSMRARFSSIDVLGGVATEEFKEYDVAANFRLPWAWYSHSGWGVGMRMMASAGALYSDGETGLVVSLIPLVALGSQDGRFTLDMGAGGALLSRHRFGTQDFGGNFQFALTVGVGVPLFERLGVGYRYLHYSDAGINGSHTTGADLHMLELTYRF
jgi:hypothetical protein